MYFENDSEEKLKGTVEVRTARYVGAAWVRPSRVVLGRLDAWR